MLDYGYQRALEVMRFVSKVLIATDGPAGLLVGEFQCQSHGMQIFLFLPNTSDHLFNLENNPAVTLFCSGWEISGRGHIISDSSIPHDRSRPRSIWPPPPLNPEQAGR